MTTTDTHQSNDTPTRVTPTSRGTVRPSTDDTVRMILRGGQHAPSSSYHLAHHGEPACGIEPRTDGEYIAWPTEKAQAWRDPCGFCFPEGGSE